MGLKKGRRRGEEPVETIAVNGRENGELILQNRAGVDLYGWEGDKRERKRKFVSSNVMDGGEEESNAEQHDARNAGDEGKKKEEKNKNKKRKIDVDEQRGEGGDAYKCSVGMVRDDGKVKEGKMKDKKNRRVEDSGGEKSFVDFDRIELKEDRVEKRKKKHKAGKYQDEKSDSVLGSHGSEQGGEKVEPKPEKERKGMTDKKLKNKMIRKKSDQMQIEETIDEAQKNRGENVPVLGDCTGITEVKSDNKGGKNKKEKLGRRNLDCTEDNQGIEEQLDIYNPEVTNRKYNSQNGKRKGGINGCSNMNSGEECDRQSICKDGKQLASGLDAHLTSNLEEEEGYISKKHEKKRKRATVKKNCSKGNSQEKTDDDVLTIETAEATHGKVASKKVAFADAVEVFPLEDSMQEVVSGTRYTKEENELLKQAIYNYIEFHGLGENGVEMLLNCRKYKLSGCWREIAKSLPWRDRWSVYRHGIMLLTKGNERIGWTPEDLELILQYHKKHGSKWSTLAKSLGRYRYDVKDMFRMVGGGPVRKGKWAPEELDALYSLVNKDLRARSIYRRKTHSGIFRDNIAWTSISEQMGSRSFLSCCHKWYSNITSPMVSQKIWADTDDYRLVDALAKLDSCSFVEVDWDNLLEHRSGELCVRRWKELIRTVDRHYAKSFMELVEVLSQRYSWDVLEAREAHDKNSEEGEAHNKSTEEGEAHDIET